MLSRWFTNTRRCNMNWKLQQFRSSPPQRHRVLSTSSIREGCKWMIFSLHAVTIERQSLNHYFFTVKKTITIHTLTKHVTSSNFAYRYSRNVAVFWPLWTSIHMLDMRVSSLMAITLLCLLGSMKASNYQALAVVTRTLRQSAPIKK